MSGNALHSAMQLNGAATSLSKEHAVKHKLDVTDDADGGPAKKAKAEARAARKAKKARAAKKAKAAKKAEAKEAKATKKAKAAKKAEAKEAKGKIEPKTTGAPAQLQFGTGTRDAPIDVDALSSTEPKCEPKPAQITLKCKCKACEKCHPNTAADWNAGVQCGRKCPACALFCEVYKKDATFTVNDKVYIGCSTCMIIDKRGKVSKLCQTCFSRSCGQPAGRADEEDPLGDMQVRLYRKKGIGIHKRVCFCTMYIYEAQKLFTNLGKEKSLACLTPAGAEGAVEK